MKSTWKGFHHFRSLQVYLSAAGRSQQQLSTLPLLVKHTPCFIMLRTWNKKGTEQRCSLSTRSRTAELLQAAKETVTDVPQISGVSLSRLQSKMELSQGAFPLLEMMDVPHTARAQQRALLWASLTYSGCLLKTSCRREWFLLLCCAQKHLDLFHHLPVYPAILCLYKTSYCHITWMTPVYNWQESQQIWEMKERRNRGSLDE